MKIDKKKLKLGIWYTDDNLNMISMGSYGIDPPEKATIAHTCFPLEIRKNMYRLENGKYNEETRMGTFCTRLSDSSGKLAVAMVNSGDYTLSEALVILSEACERCVNVLYNKYLPEEDIGYLEFSDEWYKCRTSCIFCSDDDETSNVINKDNPYFVFVIYKDKEFQYAVYSDVNVDVDSDIFRCHECVYSKGDLNKLKEFQYPLEDVYETIMWFTNEDGRACYGARYVFDDETYSYDDLVKKAIEDMINNADHKLTDIISTHNMNDNNRFIFLNQVKLLSCIREIYEKEYEE